MSYIEEQYEKYMEGLTGSTQRTYIQKRLIDQINWYDNVAAKKQKNYKVLMGISIVLTAIIPVFSLFTTFSYGVVFSAVIAVLSGSATAVTSIANLCEYQKLWVQYRSNCELLKSMLHRYFTSTGEFCNRTDDEKFNLLVALSEEYLINEFRVWSELSHNVENS